MPRPFVTDRWSRQVTWFMHLWFMWPDNYRARQVDIILQYRSVIDQTEWKVTLFFLGVAGGIFSRGRSLLTEIAATYCNDLDWFSSWRGHIVGQQMWISKEPLLPKLSRALLHPLASLSWLCSLSSAAIELNTFTLYSNLLYYNTISQCQYHYIFASTRRAHAVGLSKLCKLLSSYVG